MEISTSESESWERMEICFPANLSKVKQDAGMLL